MSLPKSKRQIKPYSGKIKVGKEKLFFLINPTCPICQSELRMKVDKYSITHGLMETLRFCRDNKLVIGQIGLKSHLAKHSYYLEEAKKAITKTAENLSLARIDALESTVIGAETVIDEIITIGGQKIRSGEMEVDGKLLLGALKEQGLRKKLGSLQEMMQELDKARFQEGEIVEKEPEL